jgi:hypothetical protein
MTEVDAEGIGKIKVTDLMSIEVGPFFRESRPEAFGIFLNRRRCAKGSGLFLRLSICLSLFPPARKKMRGKCRVPRNEMNLLRKTLPAAVPFVCPA